jgi:two-component system LytT family response regulator
MRALIIDDERMARQELRRLLVAHAEIEILGEARSGEEALTLIRRHNPDVLFLDIHMPGMSGFELLEKLEDVPQVVFTTAYDTYALKAFDAGALDYVVKPVAPDRLAAALGKLRPPQASATCPGDTRLGKTRTNQVFVKDGDRCWLVKAEDIYLLESEGNYTRLYFGKERPLIPRSLSALQERMDPAMFFRAGRRHIVNLKWVERVEADSGSGFLITLRGGMKVEMSRRQSVLFRAALSL